MYNEIQISMRTWRSWMSAASQGAFVDIPKISRSDSSMYHKKTDPCVFVQESARMSKCLSAFRAESKILFCDDFQRLSPRAVRTAVFGIGVSADLYIIFHAAFGLFECHGVVIIGIHCETI